MKWSVRDMQSHYPIMNLPQPRGTNYELNDHEPEVMTLINEAYITINTNDGFIT
jgi:hypothetical protein